MIGAVSPCDRVPLSPILIRVRIRIGTLILGAKMPKLVHLYIKQVLLGFGLSALFVGGLLYTNVGNLWHLVTSSDIGMIAVIMLFMANGIIFAGVQFAIVIMRMGHADDTPKGGKRQPIATDIPVRVEAAAPSQTPQNAPQNRF